ALRPDANGARCSLAEALFQLGEIDAAMAEYQRAAQSGDPEIRAAALGGVACMAPGSTGCDNAAVLAVRHRWVDFVGYEASLVRSAAARKLRVGYLSAFFGARNWMKFVWGVINYHDRDMFEIHLLSDGDDPSAESGLDVLVDLNGYSGQERLPLFRYRPARLQVSWMGMYGTTGIPEIDCVV